MLEQMDVDFILDIYTCSQEQTNIFEYAQYIKDLMSAYLSTSGTFFIYSNGTWFNQHKQNIEDNKIFNYSLYDNNIQIIESNKTAFFMQSYLSTVVILCNTVGISSEKLTTINCIATIIRNTLEKITREQLANNFKHQIQHLKSKLNQAQNERTQAITAIEQTALELKNPLTSIQGYTEIIKASLPTTNNILRSLHYYSDMVLNNTNNIINKINEMLNIDSEQINYSNIETIYKYKNLTAVLADNWLDNSVLLKIFLETIGINCLSANNQEEILELAKNQNPDFILIDENINNGQGIQTAIMLRQANFNNPIIGLTTNFKKSKQTLYLQSGFSEIIAKPINKENLFKTLEKYFSTKNVYANKNAQEIEIAQKAENNKILMTSGSEVASKIFLKNIAFNISALKKAHLEKDYLTIKKITNIIRRTSGSIGLLDMSFYADTIYKAVEERAYETITSNLKLLVNEMEQAIKNQSTLIVNK
jgi:CheY-like chemotaxis protein